MGLSGRVIYTIGHSNRSIGDFLEILKKYKILVVFDVRRFPSSRKFPHFNKENLRSILEDEGIKYYWLESLGGYRGYIEGAEKYKCFRAQGYRNYAAWMQTKEWKSGFQKLIRIASRNTSVVMCSEKIPWRCHRKLISDALLAKGFKVLHIIEIGRVVEHKPTKCARIEGGKLEYI